MPNYSTRPVKIALLALTTVLFSYSVQAAETLTPERAQQLAREATIYGFPLVDNYRVMYSYFVDEGNSEFKAPWNQLNNTARVYTPEDKAIQTPNSDTPYSQLGADLRAEPLVISVPEVEKDRYYSLQFIDLYTHNFAYVGSRSTGNDAGRFLLAGPNWSGETPEGIKQVIRSETDLAFILYRTQLKGDDDLETVKKIQASYTVEPLSSYLKGQRKTAPEISFLPPQDSQTSRTEPEFFNTLAFLLQFAPVHPSEVELRKSFAEIGIEPGKTFKLDNFPTDIQKAIRAGQKQAWDDLATFKVEQIDTGKRTSADSFGTREFLKNDYLARMSGAVFGIYGHSKEEAIYPLYFVDSTGQELDGKHRYALRFNADQLPPVNSFWSLTMYGLPESLLVDNSLNRYLINSSMIDQLKRDHDGSITLYLQHEAPSDELKANWLPAPKGPFWATMRLYWPKEEALSGQWQPPALKKISDAQ